MTREKKKYLTYEVLEEGNMAALCIPHTYIVETTLQSFLTDFFFKRRRKGCVGKKRERITLFFFALFDKVHENEKYESVVSRYVLCSIDTHSALLAEQFFYIPWWYVLNFCTLCTVD